MDVALRHVDVVEQVLLHETAVALRMVGGKSLVLVQIHGAHAGEVDAPRLLPGDQFPVQGDGSGAGGKTQHAGGFGAEQFLKTVRRQTSRLFGVFRLADVQMQHSFSPLLSETPAGRPVRRVLFADSIHHFQGGMQGDIHGRHLKKNGNLLDLRRRILYNGSGNLQKRKDERL